MKFVFDTVLVLAVNLDLPTVMNQNQYKPVSYSRETHSKMDNSRDIWTHNFAASYLPRETLQTLELQYRVDCLTSTQLNVLAAHS